MKDFLHCVLLLSVLWTPICLFQFICFLCDEKDGWRKMGTRSVLVGYHQFLIHPLFVALGWWKLYGFPWDPRLWVAFFVHDLGYLGKPNMDGPEGEKHPWTGAKIMGMLFDERNQWGHRQILNPWFTKFIARPMDYFFGRCPEGQTWYCFSFYHSRFLCKRYGVEPSRLCYADKMAIIITPTWLQLILMNLTGEIHEYIKLNEAGRTNGENKTQREWVEGMKETVRHFISHKLGRCLACGCDCAKHHYTCKHAGQGQWCATCFEETPCARGHHGESCSSWTFTTAN